MTEKFSKGIKRRDLEWHSQLIKHKQQMQSFTTYIHFTFWNLPLKNIIKVNSAHKINSWITKGIKNISESYIICKK